MGGGYNNPKFYFLIGIVFNLCLLGFFKYSDFFLENFNAFSQLLKLDFNIPLPHILLPLALSFVTFQQIAFLYDCYKSGRSGEKMSLDFIDYALFISFFPQLIAGPIVHHREMIPQFKKLATNSACSDFLGSASASSLQRTESASHSSASHNPKNSSTILEFATQNSSLGETFRPFENFECSQTHSLASHSKFAKNSTSKTASRRLDERSEVPNTRIFSNAKCGETQGDSMESNAESLESSLRESAKDSNTSAESAKSTFNYEFLAKGIFIFTIGLFKKLFIADSFAKWADLGFSGKSLNLIEGWVSSLSYTFQLYFDFSGYCDMAMGLGLMFGIVLPLNFNSPYKALNIADFWRRWHISLGRFLKECVYIPLGGNRGRSFKANSSSRSHSTDLANFKAVITDEVTPALKSAKNYESTSANTRIYKESMSDFADSMESNADSSENNSLKASAVKQSPASNAKILTLRNLFIVAVLSGIWHGAGWGFVLWGLLHGGAMVIHRIYSWWLTSVNSACSEANSSSRIHSTDLANFEAVITDEVTPAPKSAKNYESTSANTRILGESQGDSMKSNAESLESSLRDSAIAESWQSTNKINPHEAQPNLAPLRGSEIEEQGGRSASALLELECDIARLSPKSETAAAVFRSAIASHQPLARLVGERGGGAALFAKKCDYINENISIESRRIERVENAESLKNSADSIESNDKMDCHDSATQNLAMTAKGDSVESSEKNKMDCHALTSVKSRNDDSMLNSHASQSDSCDDKMRVDSSHSAESAKDSINSSHFVKSINENNPHNAPHLSTKHKFIKAYLNFTHTKLYLCLCFLLTFNFINIAWVFFRAENLSIALNVLKAMFGFGAPLPEKWYSVSQSLSQIDGGKSSVAYIILAFVLCLVFKNSFELMQRRLNLLTISLAGILLMFLSLKMFATDSLSPFLYFNF